MFIYEFTSVIIYILWFVQQVDLGTSNPAITVCFFAQIHCCSPLATFLCPPHRAPKMKFAVTSLLSFYSPFPSRSISPLPKQRQRTENTGMKCYVSSGDRPPAILISPLHTSFTFSYILYIFTDFFPFFLKLLLRNLDALKTLFATSSNKCPKYQGKVCLKLQMADQSQALYLILLLFILILLFLLLLLYLKLIYGSEKWPTLLSFFVCRENDYLLIPTKLVFLYDIRPSPW